MTTFRVHFTDGDVLDVAAENPKQAREIAEAQRSGIITKIKVLKGA